MTTFHIQPLDRQMEAEIRHTIDNLNKPKGSLGRLEELALQVCLVQQTLKPSLTHPQHLLLGGDHGIECEGVSASPREVTWQQMVNFTRGGGGVNLFCRQHGFHLHIVDVGVDHDLSHIPGITHCKIARGTRNFRHEPAMTDEELNQAFRVGSNLVDTCHRNHSRIICIGEMGIGNTSPSSVWMHLLGNIPLQQCIGAGSGLAADRLRHKHDILHEAVAKFRTTADTSILAVLRHFGGYEMVAAVAAMLRAAEHRMLILVDGFIMSACALAAVKLYPAAQDYMIFTHCGDEAGHRLLLDALGARPLLSLGLRLGEGTGALCAFPLVDSAVRMINEMNNFDNAHITKYF